MTVDYGTEIDMGDDLDFAADGSVVSGIPLLKQVALIRVSTPRGSVIDAPDDGICLTDWLSKAMTPDVVASLEGTIEAEEMKDERFTAAKATVDTSLLFTEESFSVELELDSGAGPFTLTLGVSDAGVAILGGA